MRSPFSSISVLWSWRGFRAAAEGESLWCLCLRHSQRAAILHTCNRKSHSSLSLFSCRRITRKLLSTNRSFLNERRETWWRREPEKSRGSADQKHCKRIKEPVMRWVTWSHRQSLTAHPTEKGVKKKLEISRGDYCQSWDRWGRRRDQIMVVPTEKKRGHACCWKLFLDCIFLLDKSSFLPH